MEVWKDIKGFEGYYQISTHGRVRSLDRIIIEKTGKSYPLKGGILKPTMTPRGYQKVQLCKNNLGRTVMVHILVAKAFIPNIENKPQINHIDLIKVNNNVENLEWNTPVENTHHAIMSGRYGDKFKLSPEKAKSIRQELEKGKTHQSLADKYGCCRSMITHISTGRYW